jgi:putative methionine-R-sulfoxide reductase with GAF domain
MQYLQQGRRWVGLYRIKRFARELLDKMASGPPRCVRSVQKNGIFGAKSLRQLLRIMEIVQLKGPPRF